MTKFDDHQFFIDRLSAYHDQELKNEELAIIQEHIDSCAECQRQLAEFEKFDQMIDANSQLSDNDYWETSAKKIEAAIEQPVETIITLVESKPMTGLWWKLTAAAASVAIIAFVAMYEKDITGDLDIYNDLEIETPVVVPVDTTSELNIKGGRVEKQTTDSLTDAQTGVINQPAETTVRIGAEDTIVKLDFVSMDKDTAVAGYVINKVKNLDQTINVAAEPIVDKLAESDITLNSLQATPEVDKPVPVVIKKTKTTNIAASESNVDSEKIRGTEEVVSNKIDGVKLETSDDLVEQPKTVKIIKQPAAAAAEEIVDTTPPSVSNPTKLSEDELKKEIGKIKANVVPETVTSFKSGGTRKAANDVSQDSTDNEKAVALWQGKLKKLTESIDSSAKQSNKAVVKSYSATKSAKKDKRDQSSASVDSNLTMKIMECHYNIARLTENKREYNNSYNYLVDQSWAENKNIQIKAEKYLKILDDMED